MMYIIGQNEKKEKETSLDTGSQYEVMNADETYIDNWIKWIYRETFDRIFREK